MAVDFRSFGTKLLGTPDTRDTPDMRSAPNEPKTRMAMSAKTSIKSAVFVTAAVYASVAIAGTDGDGIPDGVDNCILTPNGPAELSNQVDTDADGYGNACDADYTNDGSTTTVDYTGLLSLLLTLPGGEGQLAGNELIYDHDGDGHLTLGDLSYWEQAFTGLRRLGE